MSSPQSKKQKTTTTTTTTTIAAGCYRDWSSLPSDLLLSVLQRLSPRDLFAAAATCTSWRSLAKSLTAVTPPLRLHFRFFSSYAAMTTLTKPSRTFQSPLTSAIVPHECVGFYHSHLIFTAPVPRLINFFTGDETPLPQIPTKYASHSFGILTAPPASRSSIVLLGDWTETDVLFCRPNGGGDDNNTWSVFRLDVPDPRVLSVCVCNGEVFALLSSGRVVVLEFAGGAEVSWRMVGVELPPGKVKMRPRKRKGYGKHMAKTAGVHLVERGGDLLLVAFVHARDDREGDTAIRVFRLNFARCAWEETRSIGDWCLFMDCLGRCQLARPRPSVWGGRSNCVYVAEMSYHWTVLPLDGTPFRQFLLAASRWPSPVWVYPSFV